MTNANPNGPGIDRLKQEADRQLRQANDEMDAHRRAKRRASERTPADVQRQVTGKS